MSLQDDIHHNVVGGEVYGERHPVALGGSESQLARVPERNHLRLVGITSHHVVRPDVATDPGLLTRTNRADALALGVLKNAVHGVHVGLLYSWVSNVMSTSSLAARPLSTRMRSSIVPRNDVSKKK